MATRKSDRIPVDADTPFKKWRPTWNKNFKEAIDPCYFFAVNSGVSDFASVVSVSAKTWTSVPFNSFTSKSSVSQANSNTEFVFPFFVRGETGKSSDGMWQLIATIGFDNTIAGLQAHMRKVTIEQNTATGWIVIAYADHVFKPEMLSSPIVDEEKVGCVQCFVQPMFRFPADPKDLTNKIRVRVWHNAKVAGAGTAMSVSKFSTAAPRLDAIKICSER